MGPYPDAALREIGRRLIPGVQTQQAENLGECPHYQDHEATCTFGCWDEPRCITYEPREGWPTPRRLLPLRRRMRTAGGLISIVMAGEGWPKLRGGDWVPF